MDDLQGLVTRWIEINTDAILHNVRQIKSRLQPNVKVMAVVKGDAYGCGSVECAITAVQAGCEMLGVTTLEEAVELRLHNIETPILVFSPLLAVEAKWYACYALVPTVISKEGLAALLVAAESYHKEISIQLKLETGMGRLGLRPEELPEILEMLKDSPSLKLEGIYTHFSKILHENNVKQQVNKLLQAVDICRKNNFDGFLVHACASAGLLKYPEYSFDMVRIGTLIYGQMPAGMHTEIELQDPWKFKARIAQVKKIFSGESVGYGGDFVASRDMEIGIIPVGLADGFNLDPPLRPKSFLDLVKIVVKEALKYIGRPTKATGSISSDGRLLPIVGRVGMQLTAVDVTSQSNMYSGKEVEIEIRRTSASSRLARVFFREGKVYNVRSIINQELEKIYDYRGEKA